jgi:hypothetical protein
MSATIDGSETVNRRLTQGARKLRKTPATLGEDSESRSQMLLAAMLAFRDGDFSRRLPSNWSGAEGRIAEAFNQTIAHEERITREVERLSRTVGRDGQLKQRMSLPGAVGQWANKVESINGLMDDLVRPTAEIARTIGAVAKGDLGQSMDLEADGRALQGEFLRSRRQGGRNRRQARRSGKSARRFWRLEGFDRFRQPDGGQSDGAGSKHC